MAIVWQFSVIHLENKTLISGVALKGEPFRYHKRVNRYKHLLKLAKSYSTSAYKNKPLLITANGEKIKVQTDKKGSFRAVVDFLVTEEVKVCDHQEQPLEILQNYPFLFENKNCEFEVISDFDDTIIISNTASVWKRISTLAFKIPHRRKVIGFTQKLFREFEKKDARVFYVSKSESNLFSIIAAFIKHNELPKGPLLLTPFLKARQLFNPKKGRDYKVNHIEFLLEHSGDKKFVLFGDDSQKDMEVYSDIAYKYADRLIKIYIRQTRSNRSKRQLRQWEILKSQGVPVKYFNNEDDAYEEVHLYS